jgi:hypothetical protein
MKIQIVIYLQTYVVYYSLLYIITPVCSEALHINLHRVTV